MSHKDPLPVEENELCVCFHVPLNKIEKFIRLNEPRVASQVSGCYGAGTGCGWCVPFIEKVFEQMRNGEAPSIKMTRAEYLERRREYHQKTGYKGKGSSAEPGAPDPADSSGNTEQP